MKITLNVMQEKAVLHNTGPMLVLAGPGSGKTTVVLERVKHLIFYQGVRPQEILVITFTKSAAVEMEKRFQNMGLLIQAKVAFGTFHSLFFKILRNHYGYSLNNVISEEEKWSVLRTIIREENFQLNDEEEYIKGFLSELSLMKNDLIDIAYYHSMNFPAKEFQRIYEKYEAYKTNENKIDFDDMMIQCYELFTNKKEVLAYWRKKFSYLLVDEFQDINKAQYECIKLLAQPKNNLFVVGDDDQSIYSFRGAKPEFLLNFKTEYENAQIVTLDINYRSTDHIIKLADRIIRHNKNRFEKKIKGTGKEGRPTTFFTAQEPQEEARKIAQKINMLHERGIGYEKMAIIFRTNMQAGNYARALMDAAIPYNLKDMMANIYENWITRDILAYLSLAQEQSNNKSFIRIINKPKRYISKEIQSELSKMSGSYINTIFGCKQLQKWQSKQIMDLKQHLLQIRQRKPFEAIKYIRNVVAYDDYLQKYAEFRKTNLAGLKEIANEITQTAKDCETVQEYIEKIQNLSKELTESRKNQKKPIDNAVVLSTMHSAKGLEFEAVFIPGLMDGLMPHEKSVSPDEIEGERRLFYVAVTRAMSYLCLSESEKRYDKDTKRSLFLKEIGLKDRAVGKIKKV